jgi:elongation factor G
LVERLRRRFKVELELAAPKVAYRETIKSKGDSKYRHKKQTGGAGQFAEVWMRIEPKMRDSGLEFTQSLVGQNVDGGFVPSVEKGVMSACREGLLAGYRIVDLKVVFYDGKMHPVDSGDVAFQIAGKEAFRESFNAARPCLLEPIHKLRIRAPEECLGKIIGDLSSRRGKVMGMEAEGSLQILSGEAPARELHHYATVLRSLTGGRGIHEEEFSHYEEMPRELEAKVIEEAKRNHAAAHAH